MDLTLELKMDEAIKSPLECACGSNGIILSLNGTMRTYCPKHILCAFSEEYRLGVLRDYYRNVRKFLVLTTPFERASDIDMLVKSSLEEEPTPEEWVRSIQRLLVLNRHLMG